MRMTEREWEDIPEDHFPNMVLIRSWPDCKIWSAGVEKLLLVLVDTVSRRAAIFEYDTPAEREQEIQRVLRLSDNEGDGGAAVPAFTGPIPPNRPARKAQSFPMQENQGL